MGKNAKTTVQFFIRCFNQVHLWPLWVTVKAYMQQHQGEQAEVRSRS
jgi:hypothetical protein